MTVLRAFAQRAVNRRLLFVAVLLVLAYVTVVPLVAIFFGALTTTRPGAPFQGFTLEVVANTYSSARLWSAGLNTLVFATGVTFVALAVGSSLAWIVERTNTPFGSVIFLLSVIRLIVPGLLLTMAWIYLLGPRAGILNIWLADLLGLNEPLFNVFSFPGMIFVEGLQTAPLVFLLMVAAFRSTDPTMEEAARVSGAPLLTTLRRITLPSVRPAFLAAGLIAFVTAFEGFEAPALIGLRADPAIRTFSTEIFLNSRQAPTDFNAASAYGIIYLATTAIAVFLYQRSTRAAERFATITGKGYRPSRIDLGRWRWVTMFIAFGLVAFMFVLPVMAIAWRSLQPFSNAPSLETIQLLTLQHWEFVMGWEPAWSSLRNSMVVAVVTGVGVMGLTSVAAWLVSRGRMRGRSFLDLILFIPIAMPGLVLGLAFAWFTLSYTPFLHGTLIILIVAHGNRFIPYGMRFASSAMVQVDAELEGAGYVSGANFLQTFRRILLPLITPGLIAGFIFVVVGSFRELSASILLFGFDSRTFPVTLFDAFNSGQEGAAAAMAIMAVMILGALVVGFRLVGGRLGIRT